MIIEVKNSDRLQSRMIRRADKPVRFGYCNYASTGRALTATLTGQDGKVYKIILRQEDLAQIDAARAQYKSELREGGQ